MSKITPQNTGLSKPEKRRKSHPGNRLSHINMIRQLPCVLTGRPAEAAHVSYPDLSRGKLPRGKAQRADDKWAVPLCPELHRLNVGCQHDSNEMDWWSQFGVDPLQLAEELFKASGDHVEMSIIVAKHTPVDRASRAAILKILRR